MQLLVSGYLRELKTLPETPVQYYLQVGEHTVAMNDWIGQTIRFDFHGNRACVNCGRKVKKLYNNGYCYPCVTTLAECDLCIVKPHECHFDQGTCRDEQFGLTHCMIPHYVYLAFSNHVKVGLTRKGRQLTRWVDQGAIRAIPIAELPTRRLAGELEVAIGQYLPDKTDWRKMLKGDFEDIDLLQTLSFVQSIVPEPFQQYLLDQQQVHEFVYPQIETIDKVKSIGFDKMETIEGRLIGIKGQYLILEQGVLNIKKHSGYEVSFAGEKQEEQAS